MSSSEPCSGGDAALLERHRPAPGPGHPPPPLLERARPELQPSIEQLQAETRRLERETRRLYCRYVIALAAATTALLLLLFTLCQPLVAPLFGDSYFFGSSTF